MASTSTGLHGLELRDADCVVQAEPEAFGGAIIDLLHHPERLPLLAEAGREAARVSFDRDTIGADLLEFYKGHVRY